jgi:cytochrome P450
MQIAHRKRQPTDASDVWATLGRIIDPNTRQPLGRELMRSEVALFVTAAFDTNTNTLTAMLYLLARHPDAQACSCRPARSVACAPLW